ncbi:stage II sporulation protein D [Anaerobacterium chartisolvens]|uniref:Stage II sporulation protein D n=2 Tax=Anaerobacterium chartisolvens TaxID=1297424 RepID=A0A369AQC9_9FIRM|nr:stage II sporulation protein D [Anaerobacterium chartisolvens]RCX11233.1 stage II sporulation protein D [Anaerobacterium chartisolvens]
MKNFVYYMFLMMLIMVVLPLFIIKGCSFAKQDVAPKKPLPLKRQAEEIKIKVYVNSEKKTEEMPLEEYVKGVVAAEMPAEFGAEALKAQAVAARTYAVGRMKGIYKSKEDIHPDAHVCTDFAHCQAWVSKAEAFKKWGAINSFKYWSKIERAVKQTEGVIITYDGKIINPVFHSNSGGRTENAEDVWEGANEPYLKSVASSGEENSASYKNTVVFKIEDFYDTIKNKYSDFEIEKKDILQHIKIIDYTEGNRVRNIRVGNISMKGTEFRTLFSLKSANFKLENEGEDSISITTLGNGHGAGMSQWGANYLSVGGGSYEEILKYYYRGVDLAQLNINDT